MKRECQRHRAVLAFALNLGVEISEQTDTAFVAEADDIAIGKLPSRLHQCLPARPVEALDERGFDFRLSLAADAAASQLRRNNLGVVDHKLIARLKEQRQLGNRRIRERLARFHHEHARRVARTDRPQRDITFRKFEIEEISTHDAQMSMAGTCPAIRSQARL